MTGGRRRGVGVVRGRAVGAHAHIVSRYRSRGPPVTGPAIRRPAVRRVRSDQSAAALRKPAAAWLFDHNTRKREQHV